LQARPTAKQLDLNRRPPKNPSMQKPMKSTFALLAVLFCLGAMTSGCEKYKNMTREGAKEADDSWYSPKNAFPG
jgi:hypothetical protein